MAARLRLFIFLLANTFFISTLAAQQPVVPAGSRLVMAHFKNDGGGGDERLYISVSPDGLTWTALNGGAAVWQPPGWSPWANVVRDPTIIYDNGFYWVAYTSGNYGNHESFGLAKSRDLLNWTYVGEMNVLLPGAPDQLTWNPVFFRDGDGSVHIFVNISPTGGSTFNPFGTMRTYETHPTNGDWTVWTTPKVVNLPGGNSNEFYPWKEGRTYHAVYVDFSRQSAWVKVSSTDLISGWGNEQVIGANTYEGGMILKKADGSGYRFYAEPGNSKGPQATYQTCELSATFTNGTPLQPVQSSIGMRNGKMTTLAGTMSFPAWQSQVLPGRTASEQAPEADPDGDGLNNLLEAASALDPLSLNRSGHPIARFNPLALTYRRAPWLAATLTPEISTNLQTWTSNGLVTDSITLLTDGTEEIQVRDSVPSESARFIRLHATLPATNQLTTLRTPTRILRRPIRSVTTNVRRR